MNLYRSDIFARIADPVNRVFARLDQNRGLRSIVSVLTVSFWLLVIACVLWLWGTIDLQSGLSSGN